MSDKFWTNILFCVMICTAAFFLFANLGNQYLWQDEAETALVSKTILTDGIPRGYDGRNCFSQLQGRDCDKNYVWCRHTWLPFYVLAGFYKIFGVTTFISRLPFAIFGLGTIILTYFFAELVWPGRRVSIISVALLTLSVAFMLLCRQCRYYSMVMFFTTLSFYAYVLLLNRKKYAGIFLFVAMTLLFHSQHIYLVIISPAIFLHTLIFHRNRLKAVLIAIAAVILINSPWLIWLAGINHTPAEGNRVINEAIIILAGFNFFVANIIVEVLPVRLIMASVLIILLVKIVKTGSFPKADRAFLEKIALPIFFVIFNIAVVILFTPFPFFRYAAPSIPLLIILIAVIIAAAARIHILFAAAIIVILVSTSKLKDFCYEITHNVDGTCESICRYLNEHGKPDDTVMITYGDMTLKFYTKMRIYGGLTGESIEPAKNAKWIIIRKYDTSNDVASAKKYLLANINLEKYLKIVLDYPDTPRENREDFIFHSFYTVRNGDKTVIYKRID